MTAMIFFTISYHRASIALIRGYILIYSSCRCYSVRNSEWFVFEFYRIVCLFFRAFHRSSSVFCVLIHFLECLRDLIIRITCRTYFQLQNKTFAYILRSYSSCFLKLNNSLYFLWYFSVRRLRVMQRSEIHIFSFRMHRNTYSNRKVVIVWLDDHYGVFAISFLTERRGAPT